jgi:hypothetical protein
MATRPKTDPMRKGFEHVGHSIIDLVDALPEIVTYEDEYQLGKAIYRAMKAGLKGHLPGKQSDMQVDALLDKMRPNFNRQLAREARRRSR